MFGSVIDKPKKPQFYAIKLSVNKEMFSKYIMKESFLSHVTLKYKPQREEIEAFNAIVGSEVTLKSKYILTKDGVGSTLVFQDVKEYFGESEAHLTISTNGQSPSISNDIIIQHNERMGEIKCIPFELKLSGIICGAVYGKKGLTFVSDAKWLRV